MKPTLFISLVLLLLNGISAAYAESKPVHVEFLRDDTNSLDINQISLRNDWQRIAADQANFGFTSDSIWLKIRLTNPERIAQHQFIRIAYPLLDHVTAYEPISAATEGQPASGFRAQALSDRVAYDASQRQFDKYYLFDFEVDAQQQKSIYIQVETQSSMTLPIEVFTKQQYALHKSYESYWFGALYGTLIAMMLYNLAIAITLRSVVYFLYVGYMSGFTFLIASLNGDGFQYLWSQYPSFNNISPIIGAVWPSLFTLPLAYVFLDIPKYAPRLAQFYKVLYSLVWISIPLLPFLDYLMASKIMNILNMIYSPVILITAIYFSFKKKPGAKTFALAWLVLAISLTMLSLSIYNIIPSSVYVRQAYSFGGLIELVIISLALARVIDQSIRERNAALKKSETYLSKYLDIFNRSSAGIFSATLDGKITTHNRAFRNMIGAQESDIQQLNLMTDISANSEEFRQLIDHVKHNNEVSELPILCNTFTGEEKWLAITVQLTGDQNDEGDNEGQSLEGHFSDINDRMLRLQEKEQADKQRLESLKMLIAGISHELNTPIGNNLTTLSFLEELRDQLNKEQHPSSEIFSEGLDILTHNEHRISQLVKRFKLVSTGYLQAEPHPTDIESMMEIILIKADAKAKNVKIRYSYQGEKLLMTFEEALAIVFEGLIDNSLRHAFDDDQKGEINIDIAAENNTLTLDYQDNGKGIPEHLLNKIFDPFFTTSRGSEETSGLGLYGIENIVKNLFHGSIEIERGEGFHLRLVLPLPEEHR